MNESPPPGASDELLTDETLQYVKNSFAFIEEGVKKHGPVFRTKILGKPTAVIAGPDACSVWIDQKYIMREGAQPGFLFEILAGPSLPHLDDGTHLERKKQVLAAFTREAITSYLPGLQQITESNMKRWEEAADFAWIPEFKRLAIEGICTNFLGWEAGPKMQTFVEEYDTVTKGLLGVPSTEPGSNFSLALEARDRLIATYEKEIERQSENQADTGLTRIFQAKLPEGGTIQPDALKREMHHIIIAGYIIFSEFAWIVQELDRQPEIRKALEQEIREKAGSGPLSLEILHSLSQLTRFVMEIKRLCPIVPSFFGKARQTFEFKGTTIPEGWMVLWGLRSSHLRSEIYEDPETFDPDRFGDPRNEHKKHEHAFAPQGPGPDTSHKCAGTDYSTWFLNVFTVTLLRGGYQWTFPAQDRDYNWGMTPPEPKDGLRVRLTKS